MPKIPTFDGRFGAELATNAGNPNTQLYVPPARASTMEEFGKTVSGIGDVATNIFVEQQKRVAADYVTKRSSEVQENLVRTTIERKQKALESGNVEGFTFATMEGYDKVMAQAVADAPNKLAAQEIQQRMLQNRGSFLEQTMRFESQAKIDIYKSNLDMAVDRYARTAVADTAQLPTILKQLDQDMVAARSTLGLADAQTRLADYKSQIVATAVSSHIDDNPSGAQALLDTYKDNVSAKDYISLEKSIQRSRKRLEAEAKAAAREANEMASAYGAINDNIPLDPTDAKSRRAFDKYYNAVKKQNPDADLTETVVKTNIMPTAMKNELAGKLNSGTAAQKVEAASQLNYLHYVAPNLVSTLSKSDKAKAQMISSYVEAGVAPAKAIEWAEKNLTIKDNLILKEREKAARKEDDLKFESVQSEFKGRAIKNVFPPEMQADYELLAKAYYIDNGLPADQASKAALNDVKALWTLSDTIGRKRYMKNAPEVAYKVGSDQSWIREQFEEEFLKTKLLDGKVPDKKMVKNLIIQPNPTLDNNGKPVYNLYTIDDDTGSVDVVYDEKGKQVIFYPQFETSPTYKKMLDKYKGETFEEKHQRYLDDMKEQQMKQLTRGQPPTGFLNVLPAPGGM